MISSNKKKIVTIMKENTPHAYLATCDNDQPIVRSVSAIVEDDSSIWVTTFCTSRKIAQIQHNPKTCLLFVEQPDGNKAATVIGDAIIISDLEEKKRVWKLAYFDISKYFPDGPESEEYCLLKISIKRIEWRESRTSKMQTYELR